MLIPLEVEKVVEKIDEILERYEVNWKTLLLVVSIIQVCHPTGNKLLKGILMYDLNCLLLVNFLSEF